MPTAISNLVDLLQQRVEERPDDSAYVFLAGSELHPSALTYRQVDLQARTVAAHLQALGLQGERVLLLYPPGLDFIAAFLGCLYAGSIAVPIYPPRMNRNALRILAIAEDSQATVALTTSAVASRSNTFKKHTPGLEKLRWIATDALGPALAADWRGFSPLEEELAYLQYTSGSTAAPRGVMVTHGNILHNSAYIAEGFAHNQNSVSLCWLPHFHDMGLLDGIIQPLYSGFTGYLMSPASFLQEPVRWLQAISKYRVTHSGGPNFAYDLCCSKVSAAQREQLDLSSWEVAYNGAEPVHVRTIELFANQFEPCGFRRSAFYPAYGLAEATLKVSGGKRGSGPAYCTLKTEELEQNKIEVTQPDDPAGRTLVGSGSTGCGARVRIVDSQSHCECAAGQVGEIWVSGPGVAAGYWNRPDETREVFAAFLQNTGEGPFLRTGDLGFLQNREVFVTGRLKDLIIIRGRNHYPQDIEITVRQSHPVLEGMPGTAFSVTVGTEERLAMVQEIDSRQSNLFGLVTKRIRRAVTDEHEIQPYAILLVRPGAVPRTSSGKVQRHLCRQQFLEGSFKVLEEWREASPEKIDIPGDPVPLELTVDSLQFWLRAKFAAALKTDISEISSVQSTPEFGLDSLIALEISHSIEAAVGVRLSQNCLLEGWSISQLADHILSRLAQCASPESEMEIVSESTMPRDYGLSQGQQALWFLQQLAPEGRAYYISRLLRLKNEIDSASFRRALQVLVDRHASLRCVFSVVDRKPMQHVQENAEGFFQHEDASQWDSEILQQRLSEAANQGFDLACGPLFRIFLFSRSARDHLLLLAVHHIVADLWSVGLLLKELAEVYAAQTRNVPADLPPLSCGYADYVRWEEKFLQTEDAARDWHYWQKQLEGDLPPLDLPVDFPRPPVQTYKGAVKFSRFDADLAGNLKSVAIASRTTLYNLLIVLFETFLHRYTGQLDVVVGTPTAGRSRHECASIVGYFVNPVVIRMNFSGDPNFEQVIEQGRQVVMNAFEHQVFPFATVVQRLRPQRDPSRSPLFQVMFVLQKTNVVRDEHMGALALGMPGAEMQLGDLVMEAVSLEQSIAQFDLTVAMAEADDEMVASFEYNLDLFEEATVDRMMRHFELLVRGIVTNPKRHISEIPLLNEEERRQVISEWNQTGREYPACETVLSLLEAQAQKTPENPAVVFEGRIFSYRELHQRANQLARSLQKLGVRPDVVVGVCMERSLELVLALVGTMKAGGAYLPLDPSYPAERLKYMLQDSSPDVMLVGKGEREKLAGLGWGGQVVCVEEAWEEIGRESQSVVESGVGEENLAYVIYTSGSTGQPKGVMSTHGGLLNRLQWMQETYPLDQSDRILQKTPFGFDVSVWEFFWPLMYGACLVVARPEGHKDSGYLVRTIQQKKITTVHFVPSMLQAFLQEHGVQSCTSLRRVISSGEALPRDLVHSFYERLHADLHNLYGPTEASIDVSFWACPGTMKRPSIPIGRPIVNTQLYVLDSHFQPVPVGIIGELYIGGVGLARGYWRRAELTAEKFIPDPFSSQPGGRLYRTGDLARWSADGNIEYLGRADNQIKLRGFRIELGEIEAVLRQHKSVQQALVVVQDEGKEKKLIAYVVPNGGGLSQAALRNFVQEKLPEYMVPAAFVELAALPLSAHGKVNRKELPRWEFRGGESKEERPRTPTEELVAGIWSEVLGVERIGIHDNFFELGGHSLLATQITSRVREIFLIDLPLQAIFETPTISGLSLKIAHEKSDCPLSILTRISPAGRRGDLPLSFAQERMWFLHQVAADKSVYNITEGVQLSGPLDPAALNASLREIIQRHEILRTSFASVEGQCLQRIITTPAWDLEVLDLQNTNDPEAVLSLVREETRKPFDPGRAPLLRATLLKLAEDRHILLLAIHHIVADGWSFALLLRELKELYGSYIREKVPRVDELQIQYADYSEWQRQYFKGPELETQLAYWRQQLADAGPELLLPTDQHRPAVQSFRGKRHGFELSKDLSNRLKEFSLEQGVTLFMVLLAGLKVLLALYTGQRDIVVGTVVANRNRKEIEGLIGLFANTLALRTRLAPASSLADLLKRVREVCLNAYLHQEVPFEKIVAELEPERDLSHTPIFQVMCAWQVLSLEDWGPEEIKLARLPVEMESETAKFDLSFIFGENNQQVQGVIEYSSDLFEAQTISRMCMHYRRVLEQMVQHAHQSIFEISLLSEGERQQLAFEWNETGQDFPYGRTVVQMIEQQARLQPGALAVRDHKRELTYEKFNQQANQWAHCLRRMGIHIESRVAICMERSSEMVVAQLGVMKAGGAFVSLDREHPTERLQYQISDSRARVVIVDSSSREKLRGLDQVRLLCVEDERETLTAESPEDPGWNTEKEQLAYVIYTSGSTGKPKGVEIEHCGLMNLVHWHQQAYDIRPGDRGSQIAAAGFDASVWEIWPYLAAGASVEIAREEHRTSAEELREWLIAKGITVSFLPTPLAEAVMRVGEWKPQHLKRILAGGDRLRERPPQNFDVDVVNHYGPTECTVVATAAIVRKSGKSWPTIGKPISNTRVYVLDERMQAAPVGITGELYIGGAGLARGYAGNAELTAEYFVPDALGGRAGERLYRTGDQCRWTKDGELEFAGRKDHQVKIRGYRIETGEIEAVLKKHDAVCDAVVTVQQHESGEKFLIAYLVAGGKKLENDELQHYLHSKLPSYMVPSAFMQLQAFPLTASGKLNREALEKWEFISTSDHRDPRTEIEILLAEIWKGLLGLDKISIDDNFFELGGDSILSLQVVARAQRQGIKITPRQLFECRTIAALAVAAEKIEESRKEVSEQRTVEGEAELIPIQRSFEEAWEDRNHHNDAVVLERNIEAIYPLSSMQQGMLFECISAPGSGAYIQQMFCTLRGDLDTATFQSAWQKVLERHSILRTLFAWNQEKPPLQVVSQKVALPFEFQDWTEISGPEQQQRWSSLLDRDRDCGFRLSESPLLRILVLRMDQSIYRLLFTFHHLILDGWSLPLLFKEVFEAYRAEINVQRVDPEPVRPYHDYIRWLERQETFRAEQYWQEILRGFRVPTHVEVHSSKRPGHAGQNYFEQQIRFSSHETNRLQSAARQHGLTPSIFVQAAWAILLSRYSGEQDVVFGLTVSGRSADLPGIDAMIGLFINTLPVRIPLEPGRQLLSWLKELQERQIEFSQYEHSPLSQIQKWSEIPAGMRLFESIVIFENYPLDNSLLHGDYGFTVEDIQTIEVTNYPLTVTAVPRSDLTLMISHDRRCFDDVAITRMLGHLRSILLSMSAEPQQCIREVSWLTPTERLQLLVEWNQTATEDWPEQCIQDMFEEQVRRRPDDIAVTFGSLQMTYAEVDQRANQLANHLRRHGVKQETYVGLCLERSLEMVVGVLGILKAGGVYTPIDPSWPAQRKAFVLMDTKALLLLTSKPLVASFAQFAGHMVCLDSEWEQINHEQIGKPGIQMEPDSLAYVIYTSGTTGKPKGVMIGHRALCNHLRWMPSAFPLASEDRVPQKYSLSFDVSVLEIFYPLLAGARLVIAPPTEYFDSAGLVDFLIENKITAMDLVPSMLQTLVQHERFFSLTSLRQITCGGEVLSPELQAQFHSSCNAELANLYGPTEATISATFWRCSPDDAHLSVAIGRPVSNTQVYVLDGEMQPVPIGVAGELYIGGMGLARGYLREPELTAEKLVPNLWSRVPGERLYRTGDLGCYRDDGNIDYLGRADDQVKIRGFRIEPGEIESVLRAHPAVRDVAVLAQEQQLVAYVAGLQPEHDDLRHYLKKRLPEYMLPAHIVWLERFPLLSSGKVDRKALPVPTGDHAAMQRAYVAARNSMEETLTAIWSAVLKIAWLGVEDDFFELGGDSILSLQVVARAQRQGIRITPRQLFECRTIAALAAVAEKIEGGEKDVNEQITVGGEVGLTPIQRWFFEQEFAESHHWNQAVVLKTREELKEDSLAAAWKKLAEHHDGLRLRYWRIGDEWRQRNAVREENEFFCVVELAGRSEEEKRTELERVIEEMQKSLDLERGPLLRVAQIKGERKVVMVIHHLAVDAVSWRILVEDLERAYGQARRGEEIELGKKTSSYQRWAEDLVRREEEGRYEEDLEYWLRAGRKPGEEMPRDKEGGKGRERDRVQVKVELGREETRHLLQVVPGAYHTQIGDVLLTAVTRAWERWTGRKGLVIDVEGHGRELTEEKEALDVSRTVGWFTVVYPVRLEVGEGEEIGERLKGIKEQMRSVPGQGVGYGVLRYIYKDAGVREQLRRQARAEISFNYLGQVDGVLKEGEVFTEAEVVEEGSRGDGNQRSHLLEIEGRVEKGRLKVGWNYSREVHREETIEALAQSFIEELQAIIRHCLAPGAGGFTPSDFPLAHLEQNILDLLVQDHRSISDIYPLSPIQHGLLFHTLYEPVHSGTYIEQLSCTLEGKVNQKAFEQAWQEVIASQPALRTSFAWEGLQEPLQIVYRSAKALFTHLDWRHTADEQPKLLENLRRSDAEQGFNLATPPLMRFSLVQLADDKFEFLWSSHHLLLDGWGMSLVLQEVLERYVAQCSGRAFHPESHRPYRDYIAWIRKQNLEKAKEQWGSMLNGFTTPVSFSGERAARSVVANRNYCEQQVMIASDATSFLQTKVRQHQITLNTLVQCGWALLLAHYAGRRDLVFGVTVSGRPAELAGVDEMVGVFINTLPLRLSFSSDASVLSILKELQARQLQLDDYAYTPLSKIQEWSQLPAGLPLFESVVVFENYPVDASLKEPRGELKFSNVRSQASTNYPLTLVIKPGPQLTLQLIYETSRFESSMVLQLLTHLQKLLMDIVADPMARARDLQPLSERERQQLLVEWNDTVREYPRAQSIQQLFEEQVSLAPQSVAVVFRDQKLNYEELNRRANRLAHYLKKHGAGPEKRVGVYLERSLEMIVALLGTVKAGGAYVALDVESPPERLAMMLEESRTALVLTRQELRKRLPERASTQIVCVDEEWQTIAREGAENPRAEVSGEPLAYVSYTSGSTGKPKGVSVPHRAVVRLVKSNNYAQLNSEEVILQLAPPAFDASTLEIWGSLLNGGRLVVMTPGPASTDEIGRTLVEHGVTTLWLTAGLFQLMVDEELEKLKQVRQVLAGGDVLSVPHVNRYLAAVGDEAVLINGYGPTENTTFTCCHRMNKGELIEGSVPIGRPIGNTQVYVLNEEMQLVAVGVVGELYIGGEGLARGYENDAQLTAERFVPNPYSESGERLYRSGDEARWRKDGVLEFVGRKDRQVKVRGYRVEPGEIEWTLGRHEDVRETVVTVQENERGEKLLAGYVVMQPDQKFSVSDLQNYLKNRLPSYMRPAVLVPLDKLPLTPNGKVDYEALPKPTALGTSGGLILPRTHVEHAVAEIWRQVFGIERISVDGNFFDLGGHSLRALQITSRVRTVLGVALPLRTIFEEPTVADQARTIERLLTSGKAAAASEIRVLVQRDNVPLSFAQQRLWFLHQLEPASDFYNVPTALRIHGPLNTDILNECVNEIVRRHEVLRTTFPIREGVPVQNIAETLCLPIALTDFAHIPLEQAEATAGELMAQEARRSFDLSQGPLLRLALLRLAKDHHVLLVNMHHIVVDGWSLGIFVQELASLYEAFLAGRSSPLPPLSIQYADYSVWQREWLAGELLERQLVYWRQQLANALLLELPTDSPRPKVQTFRGAKVSFLLSSQLHDSLRELARRENSTLFITLLAVLKVLLHRYTSQPEITVGTPVAGRTQPETERLIGFFVNTLALRTAICGHPRFTEFLHHVREVSLGAYANQDLPFEKLVEELHPGRDQGRSPLFQVMFTFDDTVPKELVLAGLRTSTIEIENQTAQFDLTVTTREVPDGLRVSFQYNSDLYRTATVDRMMRHFELLVRRIVANPKQHISEIPLLSEEERRQVISEWNQTIREYPAGETVLSLLEAQARKTPENSAVVFEGRSFSYRELHQRANQLAHFLRKLGVGPEVAVGVCMERSLELVIALLGIMKASGMYVPLDPSLPPERLMHMIADSQPRLLLTQGPLENRLTRTTLPVVCMDTEWEEIARTSSAYLEVSAGEENPAYIIYTSGSTGTPKGVVITHRGLHNHMAWMQELFPLESGDRVLQKTAFGFDASVWEFWAPLITGAALVMARPVAQQDPEYLIQCIQEYQITILQVTPTHLCILLEQPTIEKCRSLRRVYCGGEAVAQYLVDEFCQHLPWAKLYNLYGPTESTIDATFSECIPQRAASTASLGRPIANIQTYVLDYSADLVPVGLPGELYIGGAGLARGYLAQPSQTAERFVPDPFGKTPGGRLYRTGDLVRRQPDGELEFLGRLDHQVKLRGYRIELGEIEAILKQHSDVSQAVVMLREDASGDKHLVGYVAAKNGTDGLFAHSVRDYLKTKLPEYMVPAIVQVNEIPVTVNGKIDYNAFPAISSSSSAATHNYVAPRNLIEEQIEKACCELLGIQCMSIHDNFFDLGGHSLLAMRLMTWVRDTFQVEGMPLRGFFETPTIAGMAALTVRYEARPGQSEKIAKFLQQLNAMSAEEVMTFRRKHMEQEADQNAVSTSRSSL